MKYFVTFVLLLTIGAGCKPKVLSGAALQNKLVQTMDEYLNKTPHAGVAFTIKDVVYYAEKEKKLYICQFHVAMHYTNKDTTGIMQATITNDFKEVIRTQ
ncbi:MAG: hypothetical protein ABI472_02525 [Ginsengibacter sp.]